VFRCYIHKVKGDGIMTQPQKAYWDKHRGEYKRHSVEKEVLSWMRWERLLRLIRAAEGLHTNLEDKLVFADGLAVGFATAGRINEWNKLKTSNFNEHDSHFEVTDMIVEKRYRKVDHIVECRRCQTENQKFEAACVKCGGPWDFVSKVK
jgi:hypothetical protein